jgi:hypothetical protein
VIGDVASFVLMKVRLASDLMLNLPLAMVEALVELAPRDTNVVDRQVANYVNECRGT